MDNSSSFQPEDDNDLIGSLAKAIILLTGIPIVLTILIGNGMVFLLLARFRRLRTTTNFFILGMAGADFCAGIVLIASIIIRLTPENKLTPYECLLFWCSVVFPSSTSWLTLLFVSLDRYLKVLLPLRYQTIMSVKAAICIILSIYIYSFIYMFVLPLAGLNQTHMDFNIPCFFQLSRIFNPIFLEFHSYVNIVLPLLMILVMYGHLSRVVQRKLREERSKIDPAVVALRYLRVSWLKREINTIKTLIMLLVLCIVGWIPVIGVVLHEIYNPSYQAGLAVRTIVGYLTFLNSALNPILYSLRSKHFQQSAIRMICGKDYLTKYRRKMRGATVYPLTTNFLPVVPSLVTSDIDTNI